MTPAGHPAHGPGGAEAAPASGPRAPARLLLGGGFALAAAAAGAGAAPPVTAGGPLRAAARAMKTLLAPAPRRPGQ
ncbi:hypothetical protein [Streptomyces sp. NPDC090022]|uniref:hypothetical protein n=1 Tax=Streptomyces sp. NPDC090022 TaxID=3365920 RepID=UPI00380261C7